MVVSISARTKSARAAYFVQVEHILQDLRYAFRTLVKNPAFAVVAILSLALAIARNTTISSFVKGLLFKPPSVADPDPLVEVWEHNVTRGTGIGSNTQLSYPDYEYFRDPNRGSSRMTAS